MPGARCVVCSAKYWRLEQVPDGAALKTKALAGLEGIVAAEKMGDEVGHCRRQLARAATKFLSHSSSPVDKKMRVLIFIALDCLLG
jgi:hypothetical protein